MIHRIVARPGTAEAFGSAGTLRAPVGRICRSIPEALDTREIVEAVLSL